MVHTPPFVKSLRHDDRVRIFNCDLDKKETLGACLEGVDEIIHYAGVLFKSRPEAFLPRTNLQYFRNLADVAKSKGVKRIILRTGMVYGSDILMPKAARWFAKRRLLLYRFGRSC